MKYLTRKYTAYAYQDGELVRVTKHFTLWSARVSTWMRRIFQ